MSRSSVELYEKCRALLNAGADVTQGYYLDKLVSQARRSSRYPYHPGSGHEDFKKFIGKQLTTIPKSYATDVLNFIGYLEATKNKSYVIEGIDTKTGEKTSKEIPYVHRWTATYVRGFYAKMYQLESALNADLRNVTMISLTVGHRLGSPEECLRLLVNGWRKLRKVLHKRYGTIDFFRVLEPHKSGWPHMHVLYMNKISAEDALSIKKLWAEVYKLGNVANGVDFLDPRASSDGYFVSGSVGRIRGYLIKYVGKGLLPKSDDPYYNYQFGDRSYSLQFPPERLLFNALLKKTKTRLWGASRNFSKIMAPIKRLQPDWKCLRVSEHDNHEFVKVKWDHESGLNPEVVRTWKLIESAPSISQQLKEKADFNGWKIEYAPFLCISPKTGLKVGELSNYNIFEPVYSSINRSV